MKNDKPDTDRMDSLARAIKGLRGINAMTASELAEASGVPLTSIRAIETCRRPAHPYQLAQFAIATGADPRALVRGELLEWGGKRPYSTASRHLWQTQLAKRTAAAWQNELSDIHNDQKRLCDTLKDGQLALYVAVIAATFEMQQSSEGFLGLVSRSRKNKQPTGG